MMPGWGRGLGNRRGLLTQISQAKENWTGKTSIPDGCNSMCKGPEAGMCEQSQVIVELTTVTESMQGIIVPRKSGDTRVKSKPDRHI